MSEEKKYKPKTFTPQQIASDLFMKAGHEDTMAASLATTLADAGLLTNTPVKEVVGAFDLELGKHISEGREVEAAIALAVETLKQKYQKVKKEIPAVENRSSEAPIVVWADILVLVMDKNEQPTPVKVSVTSRDDASPDQIAERVRNLRDAMQLLADERGFAPMHFMAAEDWKNKNNPHRQEAGNNQGSRPNRGAADSNSRQQSGGRGNNGGGNQRGRGSQREERPAPPKFEGDITPRPKSLGRDGVEVYYIAWSQGKNSPVFSFYNKDGKYVCSTFDTGLFDMAGYDGFISDVQSAPEKTLVSLPASWWITTTKNGDYTNLARVEEPWYAE